MIALVMVGISCTSVGYKKTKSGLEYKIFEGSGKGQALKAGDIVKFEYKITYKDSCWHLHMVLFPDTIW